MVSQDSMGLSGRFRSVLFSARFRPVPFAIGLGLLLACARGRGIDLAAPSASAAVAKALEPRGLEASPDGARFAEGGKGLHVLGRSDLAIVRARPVGSDLNDLYLVAVRRSPEGVVLEVGTAYDLTSSTGADESAPVIAGARVAYTTRVDGVVKAVHVLDLRGPAKASYADFSALQKVQAAGTDLQKTGLSRGVLHDVYALGKDSTRADLTWMGDVLEAKLDGDTKVTIDASARACADPTSASEVRVTLDERGRPPSFVPWAVDRVRSVPAFGDDNMQIVKAVAFTAKEWLDAQKAKIVGEPAPAAETTSDFPPETVGGAVTSTQDPEVGFPPAALDPIVSPPQPNEGKWNVLTGDAFITEVPGVPSPFAQTFIRAASSRIFVTLWDPRVIALHMEAGTVEPVSATGEAGPGTIARTPEVLENVVAGFNGGFQAQHGEYGMQANGIMYLPPKPYGATVMELRDGSTAMGPWPGNSEVPDEILSFRQNLTMVVQDDKWNPWNRTWWGGTPPGWHDTIHTTRSGLCLTKEGYFGYFYGVDIAPEELGKAMLRTRCRYGMHLDMNAGHAGFEFYAMSKADTWKPLGRPLQADWEYEGQIKDFPDLRFRARRMIRSMGHMNFPRYIRRDERDFFYLTARRVLPGAPLDPASSAAWRVRALPQHGYPYAIATASVPARDAATKPIAVLAVDPRAVAPKVGSADDATTIVVFADRGNVHDAGTAGGPLSLVAGDGRFTIVATDKAAASGSVVLDGAPKATADTRAIVGIRDEDGVLLLAEIAKDETKRAEALAAADALLARAGASKRMHLARDTAALLGGGLGLDGEKDPRPHGPPRVRLVRRPMPNGRPYFESTPVVDVAVWRPLQMQRVRYFGKPKVAPSGSAPPAVPPTP